MKKLRYQEIAGSSQAYYAWLVFSVALLLAGVAAGFYMEFNGHYITGMNNQIVWGMPHVFAVWLIVAASGALNVASVASVFGQSIYKPMARLSALLALGLVAGGLMVLVLDLGRPFIEVFMIIVDPNHLNPTSVFAWNVILYPVFMAFSAIYLWFMLEPKMNKYSTVAGWAAFIARLVLTSGTGLIFGFLVARTSYDFAMMAPMFIIMSLSFGTATYLVALAAICKGSGIVLGGEVIRRLKRLLAVFVAAVLYMTAVFYLTKLYYTASNEYANFVLFDGGIYTTVFWVGHVVIGSVLPLAMLLHPGWSRSVKVVTTASVLAIVGGLAQMYVIIIAGQAYPLQIFPGKVVKSLFADGEVNAYSATAPEILLGLGGVALALVMVTLGIKLFRIMPVSLADADVDPHHKPSQAQAA